jgi:hypothetical protein
MSMIEVGLVDKTRKLDSSLMQAAAAALNVQVIRDLPQYWDVQASVRYLPNPDTIPVGVWPVFLVPKLPPGEGGVHLDKKNQPYALVIGTPDNNDWTIDASHETLEMLVDPAGNRMQTSRAIQIAGKGVQDAAGEYQYVMEVCDPCQGNQYAYSIQGIAVSDFITPRFYDPVSAAGTRYSFGGNITRPREVLPGCYISFADPASDELAQILFLGPEPQLNQLGPIPPGMALREFADSKTYDAVRKYRKPNHVLADHCARHREIVERAARQKAKSYHIE